MKIGTKKALITELLTEQPHTRDLDIALINLVWADDLSKNKMLTSTESITRCRRKIQQENPSLRGKYYKKRQAHQKNIQEELKNWNNEQN